MRLVLPDCFKYYKLIIFMFFLIKIRTLVSKSPFKFILLWSNKIDYFGTGQSGFYSHKCTYNNCYVTDDRNMFGGELNRFHAILFNGAKTRWGKFPMRRYPHQKYVYVNFESSEKFPICHTVFNGRFNWTLTYKFKSDFHFAYLRFKNAKGAIIGPKEKMNWTKPDDNSDVVTTYPYVNRNKTKAVAWFVSQCHRPGVIFAKKLQIELEKMKLVLDIYGLCGTLNCPKTESDRCDDMLGNDYYFYLAFENRIAKDYVTEKLYRALANDVVPIVYGGADYTRFLPPDSYINARLYTPYQLAYLLNYLIDTPEEYQKYFHWKRYYSFCAELNTISTNRSTDWCTGDDASTLCQLCKAINDPTKFDITSVYDDLRLWWTPDFETKCLAKNFQ